MGKIAAGTVLKGPTRRISGEKLEAFERVVWVRVPNAHSDEAIAKAMGFQRRFASGQNTLAFFHELFEREFGNGWIEGGKISVRWIRLVYEGDEITTYAQVEETDSASGRPRLKLKVWAENQDGQQTAAGTAEAFAE